MHGVAWNSVKDDRLGQWSIEYVTWLQNVVRLASD